MKVYAVACKVDGKWEWWKYESYWLWMCRDIVMGFCEKEKAEIGAKEALNGEYRVHEIEFPELSEDGALLEDSEPSYGQYEEMPPDHSPQSSTDAYGYVKD